MRKDFPETGAFIARLERGGRPILGESTVWSNATTSDILRLESCRNFLLNESSPKQDIVALFN